jgi:hypothetical protein
MKIPLKILPSTLCTFRNNFKQNLHVLYFVSIKAWSHENTNKNFCFILLFEYQNFLPFVFLKHDNTKTDKNTRYLKYTNMLKFSPSTVY